jgi:hypothetical protein
VATTGTFFEGKAAGVWSSIFIRFRGLSSTAQYIHGPYISVWLAGWEGWRLTELCLFLGRPRLLFSITTLLQLCALCKVVMEMIVSEELKTIQPRKAVLRSATAGTKKICWNLGHSRDGLWDEIKLRILRIRNRNTTELIATFSNTERLSSSNNDTFTLSRRRVLLIPSSLPDLETDSTP